jgi:transcriptional regulator of arginine metabolism
VYQKHIYAYREEHEMPTAKNTNDTGKARQKRHKEILALLGSHYVRNQSELVELLDEKGVEVNQGTLSRDLRELGVIKGPHGYELPAGAHSSTGNDVGVLANAIKQWLNETIVAQNQVLLRTSVGGAQPLALSIDRAGIPPALGTIAGDDTILVICATNKDARRVASDLEAMR